MSFTFQPPNDVMANKPSGPCDKDSQLLRHSLLPLDSVMKDFPSKKVVCEVRILRARGQPKLQLWELKQGNVATTFLDRLLNETATPDRALASRLELDESYHN